MSDQRPYAALIAKGEDRRQRILAVALTLLRRSGWRGTTLGQIARESGVSPAGLLHHFESKEGILNAVLDARDDYDMAMVDWSGDLIAQLERVAARFREAPDLIGLSTVLRAENLDPSAPLHARFLERQQAAVKILAKSIRRGQRAGRYRSDLDPAVKAVEIIAFIQGIETSWLLDPSTPLTDVLREYTTSLARQLAPLSDVR